MNDDEISKNSLEILERINNLISKESTILTELLDKKKEYVDLKSDKETSILSNTDKLNSTSKEIEDLKSQSSLLKDLFVANSSDNYRLLIDVLELNFNPDKDIEIICDKLPLQLSIRNDMIDELSKVIDQDSATVMDCNDNISDLKGKLVVALTSQAALIDLLVLACKGQLNKTREEVVDVLKGVNFNEEEGKEAAKIILFPEDELTPYFAKTNFDKLSSDNNKLLEENKEEENDDFLDSYGYDEPDDITGTFDAASEITPVVEETSVVEETKEEIITDLNQALVPIEEEIKEEVKEEPISVEHNVLENTREFNPFENYEEKNESNLYTEMFKEETAPISFEELSQMTPAKEEIKFASDGSIFSDIKEEPSNGIFDVVDNFDVKNELYELGRVKREIDLVLDDNIKVSQSEFYSALDLLKDYRIDIKSIPLLSVKYGIGNYVSNIEEIYNFGYELDNMEIEKFSAPLYLTSNGVVKANLKILRDYDISLKKNNGKLGLNVLAINTKDLISRIDLLITLGEYENLNGNIDMLSADVPNICERILFCDVNNIPYTEDKNGKIHYRDFVFSQKQLESLVEKTLQLDNITSSYDNNNCLKNIVDLKYINALESFYNDLNVNVSANNINRFDTIINKLNSVMSFGGQYYVYNGYVFSYASTIRNVSYLLNQYENISDLDVIITSLLFNSHYTTSDMIAIKEAFSI